MVGGHLRKVVIYQQLWEHKLPCVQEEEESIWNTMRKTLSEVLSWDVQLS